MCMPRLDGQNLHLDFMRDRDGGIGIEMEAIQVTGFYKEVSRECMGQECPFHLSAFDYREQTWSGMIYLLMINYHRKARKNQGRARRCDLQTKENRSMQT